MNKELEITLAKKGESWKEFGIAMTKSEMQLQAMAQATILKTTNPETAEDVVMAELVLKDMKQDFNTIQFERKKITSRFDDVSSRLMQPEKSLIEPIDKLTKQIITIKKFDEVRQAKERAKIEERKLLIEYIIKKTANLDADFKTLIATKVNEAYEFALGKGNISFAKKDEYLSKLVGRITIESFANTIKPPVLNYITVEEFNELLAEHCHLETDPKQYVNQWQDDLYSRFSDYAIAVNNKEQALQIAKDEAIAKQQQQDQELKDKETASKLSTMAVDTTIVQEFKGLKKVFKVKMEETPDNAILILSAVVANWAKASQKIGVKKWFQFSVQNAIVCLEKLKNEDSKFQPQGVIFAEEDKL